MRKKGGGDIDPFLLVCPLNQTRSHSTIMFCSHNHVAIKTQLEKSFTQDWNLLCSSQSFRFSLSHGVTIKATYSSVQKFHDWRRYSPTELPATETRLQIQRGCEQNCPKTMGTVAVQSQLSYQSLQSSGSDWWKSTACFLVYHLWGCSLVVHTSSPVTYHSTLLLTVQLNQKSSLRPFHIGKCFSHLRWASSPFRDGPFPHSAVSPQAPSLPFARLFRFCFF